MKKQLVTPDEQTLNSVRNAHKAVRRAMQKLGAEVGKQYPSRVLLSYHVLLDALQGWESSLTWRIFNSDQPPLFDEKELGPKDT